MVDFSRMFTEDGSIYLKIVRTGFSQRTSLENNSLRNRFPEGLTSFFTTAPCNQGPAVFVVSDHVLGDRPCATCPGTPVCTFRKALSCAGMRLPFNSPSSMAHSR